MQFTEKDVKKFTVIFLLLILVVLVYLVVRPILFSVFTGLILGYILMPLYKKVNKIVKNKDVATCILVLGLIILVAVPFWLLLPTVIDQIFQLFRTLQSLEVSRAVKGLFPGASDQFILQSSLILTDFFSKISSLILNSAINLSLELPDILLHSFLIIFVLYFTLRDADELKEFVSKISPLTLTRQKIVTKHFQEITDSILFGQVLGGIVQGIFAGIGIFAVGIPGALTVTLLTMIVCILPFLGAFIVWVPIMIYLFATGQSTAGFLFLIYNLIIVSNIDNIVRSYIVSKKTKVSQPIIFIGMMGGLLVFNFVGLIIGPLILVYFIALLNSYKDKTLYTFFSDENGE